MKLTRKQKEMLSFIKDFYNKNKFSPTLKELQNHFGYENVSSVQRHTEALKKKGFLISEKHQARSLQIKKQISNKFNIPLVGNVACGQPILAIQNIEAYIPFEVKGNPKEYFFLRAQGDSMDKAKINDGDLVLIKSQNHAENGEKILALVGDEATIKIYRDEGKCKILEPRSSNPIHKPIYVFEDLQIQGIVKNVINNK
jgi:repressor LexA